MAWDYVLGDFFHSLIWSPCPTSRAPLKAGSQGDQIGQNFAYWAIIFFGQFFENFKSSPKIHYFSYYVGKKYVSTLPKSELGYILGDFFMNTSGHPAETVFLLSFRKHLTIKRLCDRLFSFGCHQNISNIKRMPFVKALFSALKDSLVPPGWLTGELALHVVVGSNPSDAIL
jgi:hypothetical protein